MTTKLKMLPVLLLAAVAVAPGTTRAADHLVDGRRLVIKNRVPDNEQRNRVIFAARSGALALAPPGSAGDPTCAGVGGGGALLTISSARSGQSHSTPLPCQNWSAAPSGYKYRDRELDDGTCKLIVIRDGRVLRATCLGSGPTNLDYDLQVGQSQDPIDVSLELGTGPERYCLSFGGTVRADGSNGASFFARNSPAPTACPGPLPGSPSGAFVDGTPVL